MLPIKLILALFLALPIFADEPSPEALKQEIAALQQQLAALRATEDAKMQILSQTVSACFQAMDKMVTPKPPAKEQAKP